MNKLWEKWGKVCGVVDRFMWLGGLVGESWGFARVLSGFCGEFCWGFECGGSLLFGYPRGFECRTTTNTINLIERN